MKTWPRQRRRQKEGNLNQERRKKIDKMLGIISEAKLTLEELLADEQEAFDNMPEGLQTSEKGEKAENAISYLEEAVANLDEAESNLADAQE